MVLMADKAPEVVSDSLDNYHLLEAGSKVSFSDLYAKEASIPVRSLPFSKGLYLRQSDVDDVFTLINGEFRNISIEAVRKNNMITTLRESEQTLKTEVDALKARNEELLQNEDRYLHLIKTLQEQLTSGSTNESQGDGSVEDYKQALEEMNKRNSILTDAVAQLRGAVIALQIDRDEIQKNYERLLVSTAENLKNSEPV